MPKKPTLLLITLLSWTVVTAQGGVDVPYIIYTDGELYIARGLDAVPFDVCAPDEVIDMIHDVSPDGRYFIIETTPDFVTEAIQRVGGVGGGPLPNNMWYCDINTGRPIQFAGQPLGAAFFDETQRDLGNTYSPPVWSPDSTRIASVEMRYDDGVASQSLSIYDVETGLATNIALNLPPQYGIPAPSPISWIGNTLVIRTLDTNPDAPGGFNNVLLVYDELGNGVVRLQLAAQDGSSALIETAFPVQDPEEGAVMGLVWSNGDFVLLIPELGIPIQPEGDPALYNPFSFDDVSLVWRLTADGSSAWQLYRDGERALDDRGGPIVLSTGLGVANANRVAIRAEANTSTVIHAVPNGGVDVIAADSGRFFPMNGLTPGSRTVVLAGPEAWRVQPGATPASVPEVDPASNESIPTPAQPTVSSQAADCPDGVPPRLVVGESGLAVDTIPNRVRAEPGLQGARVGEIAPGNIFSVLDGPVCTDGYAWWQVQIGDITGWTAEGEGTTYWLAPLN